MTYWRERRVRRFHLLLNEPGPGQEKVIEKGKNNIKQFRWDITARKFENLFSDIADKNFLLAAPLKKREIA